MEQISAFDRGGERLQEAGELIRTELVGGRAGWGLWGVGGNCHISWLGWRFAVVWLGGALALVAIV